MSELVIHNGLKLNGSIPSGSGEPLIARNSTTGAFQTQPSAAGNPFSDAETLIKNEADPTKLAILSAAGLTTGTTRTFTLPDENGTVALTSGIWPINGSTTLTGEVTINGTGSDAAGLLFSNQGYFSLSTVNGVQISADEDLVLMTNNQIVLSTPDFISLDTGNGVSGGDIEIGTREFELDVFADAIITSINASFAGLKYNADYSANYTTRSLVDKAYVDAAVTASNGLTKTGANITLGGQLTSHALIVNGGSAWFGVRNPSNLPLISTTSTSASLGNASSGNIAITYSTAGTNLQISDLRTTKTGVQYSGDYSADFTSRSLIDKGFGDTNYWKVTDITTLSGSTVIDLGHLTGTSVQFRAGDTITNRNVLSIFDDPGGVPDISISSTTTTSNSSRFNATEGKVRLEGFNSTDGQFALVMDGPSNIAEFIDQRTTPLGLQYNGDYSANFTDRSLVDKGYVDSVFTGTSGTYTPTITGVANVDATTAYQCQYMRVGNVVTVSGRVDVDCTSAAVTTSVGISLPVASNFGGSDDCAGTGANAGTSAAYVGSDAANNRAQMSFTAPTTGNQPYYFIFTYLII